MIANDGSQSYTLGLKKIGEGLYYDNLVINQDAEGNISSCIIRYQPESSWYIRHKTEGLGYPHYSGTIHSFSEIGHLIIFGNPDFGHPYTKNHQRRYRRGSPSE